VTVPDVAAVPGAGCDVVYVRELFAAEHVDDGAAGDQGDVTIPATGADEKLRAV
jgi:hypothetical protein